MSQSSVHSMKVLAILTEKYFCPRHSCINPSLLDKDSPEITSRSCQSQKLLDFLTLGQLAALSLKIPLKRRPEAIIECFNARCERTLCNFPH